MCKIIFIGAHTELKVIPWDENQPAFSLQNLKTDELPVIKNFTAPFVYCVTTKRGCSCDFMVYSNIPDADYERDRTELFRVIEAELSHGRAVQLYCCWAGDYNSDLEERTEWLRENLYHFYIDEKEFILIRP